MPCGSSGSSEGSFSTDDLLEMRATFDELTKEKEKLRDSKSQSFELIRSLEVHVKSLSLTREEDKRHIEDLERQLNNSCQEIDYLRDQLSIKTSDLNILGEQVCSLQLKLAEMELVADGVGRLTENIKMLESERSSLMQELEDKEVFIRYFSSRAENVEESISSIGLEYQCEIESMKLESASLEQNLDELQKLLETKKEENSRMSEFIKDLELQIWNADKVIESLDEENKDLKENLQMPEKHSKPFVRNMEEQFHDWLDGNDSRSVNELEEYMSEYESILHPHNSRLAITRESESDSDSDLRNTIAKMSIQIDDYELLVKQLKEEVRIERLKAKDEAEDLAQEMAELRYQLTNMLDDECKRRASIEHISLQRIAELEAQIDKGRHKSIIRHDLAVKNFGT